MAAPSFVPNLSDGPCLYCGCTSVAKPEELLCCELCRRPAHISCLGSDSPVGTLEADNFFTLVCRTCGVEHNAVTRARMTIVQVLLLTLFNLHTHESHSARNGFYHWKIHIYNFINHHWKEIYGPESRKKKKKVVQASLSGQLSHYSQYFVSGHKTFGEGGWYRLTHSLPPAAMIAKFKQEKGPHAKATSSRYETSSLHINAGEVIKKEPEDVPTEVRTEGEEEGRRGLWFTEVDFLKSEMQPPLELFGSRSEEDVGNVKVSVKTEVEVKEELLETPAEDTELDGEMIIVDGLCSEGTQPLCLPSSSDPLAVCQRPTLVHKPSLPPSSQLIMNKPVHKDPATPKKRNTITLHLRSKIINLHNVGVSERKIAQQLSLSRNTVCRWIKRHKDGAELTDLKRRPRSRLTSREIDEKIRQAVEENPFTNANAIRDELQLNVSTATIRRRLQEAGIYQGLPMEQEWFTDEHRASRLAFAQKYVDKDLDFWSRVVFTDEKKFISSNQGKIQVCRINNTRYKRKNIQEEMKSRGVTVNVWGWVSSHGMGAITVIDGLFSAEKYVDILKNCFLPSLYEKDYPFPDGPVIFVQDQCPMHSARVVRKWFGSRKDIQLLDWPSCGYDINPIENIWGSIVDSWEPERKQTQEELLSHIHTQWDLFCSHPQVIHNLVATIPKRLQMVIENGGCSIPGDVDYC